MAVEKKVRIHRADPRPFEAAGALNYLRQAIESGNAELDIGRGQHLLGRPLPSREGDRGLHCVLYRLQTEDLPLLYNRVTGEFRPLEDVLDQAPELGQPTYYGFFPDDTMAFVYNHQGPKEAQLASYLQWIHQDLDYIFPPIARHDILEAIAASGGVRLFNIRVPTDQLTRLSDIQELAGMSRIAQGLPVGDVEIIVRAKTDDQKRALGRVIERIGGLLQSQNHSEAVEKARDITGCCGCWIA